jgi:hypothetical protein
MSKRQKQRASRNLVGQIAAADMLNRFAPRYAIITDAAQRKNRILPGDAGYDSAPYEERIVVNCTPNVT